MNQRINVVEVSHMIALQQRRSSVAAEQYIITNLDIHRKTKTETNINPHIVSIQTSNDPPGSCSDIPYMGNFPAHPPWVVPETARKADLTKPSMYLNGRWYITIHYAYILPCEMLQNRWQIYKRRLIMGLISMLMLGLIWMWCRDQ